MFKSDEQGGRGRLFKEMTCDWHSCNNEVPVKSPNTRGIQGRYCSFSCRNKGAVHKRRQKLKQLAVDYKGGKCESCGYSKCLAALAFHHREPSLKEFGIGARGHTKSWEALKAELDKCVLLCHNCHSEAHADKPLS